MPSPIRTSAPALAERCRPRVTSVPRSRRSPAIRHSDVLSTGGWITEIAARQLFSTVSTAFAVPGYAITQSA